MRIPTGGGLGEAESWSGTSSIDSGESWIGPADGEYGGYGSFVGSDPIGLKPPLLMRSLGPSCCIGE